jgi:hypothetical protein
MTIFIIVASYNEATINVSLDCGYMKEIESRLPMICLGVKALVSPHFTSSVLNTGVLMRLNSNRPKSSSRLSEYKNITAY